MDLNGRNIYLIFQTFIHATCWAVDKMVSSTGGKAERESGRKRETENERMQFMTYFRQIIKCFITFYTSFFRIEFQVLCLLLMGTIKFRYTTTISSFLGRSSVSLDILIEMFSLFLIRCWCFLFEMLWWIPILTYPTVVLDVVYVCMCMQSTK